MAIYEISRTDAVQPGEFVSAVVIAPGVDQARRSVDHFPGVKATGKGRNVEARKLDTTGPVRLVSVYEDERTPEPQTEALTDDVSWGDADFVGKAEPEYLS
ncbi:hypothetical protein HOS59_gp34 [Streptomyces phage Rowa]|uniref:Uncharacterized protein n=1 Tax=Streptomyces phage Rowa TaxID=2059883 RepID=A0A2H5BLU3_9CAUD|nr:hypothetical protein HOS59_gp34 [Streptomyces phage Rowa]AUG87298.1 hypothetical protein SEA_ROWA_34 [Streptomyces phage Rowa]